jgi:serine/threonine-protein kinase
MSIPLKKTLITVALIIGAFFIGILVFNFIVMPGFVKLGREVEVPEVIGRSLDEAETILSRAKLHSHVQSQIYDPLIPEGFVARQTPAPGKKVKEGKRISLVVSSGPQLAKVPDLAGVRLEQAERLVNLVGLTVGDVVYIHSSTVPEGAVIESHPPSDDELELGKPLDLVVSKGKEKEIFAMPNLIGLSRADAEDIIETRKLVLGEVKAIETESFDDEKVLLQGPLPGDVVTEGDTVELGISSPAPRP